MFMQFEAGLHAINKALALYPVLHTWEKAEWKHKANLMESTQAALRDKEHDFFL